MEDIYVQVDDITPRTALRHQLKVLDPEETPAPVRKQPIRQQISSRRKLSEGGEIYAAKRIKGKDNTNLQRRVLERHSQQFVQSSTSILGESLNVSSISGVDQTYANLSAFDSSDSSINATIDLAGAARFLKRTHRPLKALAEPGVLLSLDKSPKSHGVRDLDKSPESHVVPPNIVQRVENFGDLTYAGVSTSMMESSSDSIDYEAVKKMRYRPKKEALGGQMHPESSLPHNLPPKKALESDITYGSINNSVMESSSDSIDYGVAKNMRYRTRKRGIVLDEFDPVLSGQKLSQEGRLTHSESVVSADSPGERESVTGEGNPSKKFKSLNDDSTEKWKKSPNSRSSASRETLIAKLDKTYDLDYDESFENEREITRQRFGRKATLKLNVSALLNDLKVKKSSAAITEDSTEEKEEALRAQTPPFVENSSDEGETESDWQVSKEISSPKNKATLNLLSSEGEKSGIPQREGVQSSSPGRMSGDAHKSTSRFQEHILSPGGFSSDSEDTELQTNISAALFSLHGVQEEESKDGRESPLALHMSPIDSPTSNHGALSPRSPSHRKDSFQKSAGDGATMSLVMDSPRENSLRLSHGKESPSKSIGSNTVMSPVKSSPRKSTGRDLLLSPSKDNHSSEEISSFLTPSRHSPRKSIGKDAMLTKHSPNKSVGKDAVLLPKHSPKKSSERDSLLSSSKHSSKKSIEKGDLLSPAKHGPRSAGKDALLSPTKTSPRRTGKGVYSHTKISPKRTESDVLLSPTKISTLRTRRDSLSPTMTSPETVGRSALLSPSKPSPRKAGKGALLSPSKPSPRKAGRGTLLSPTKASPRRDELLSPTKASPRRNTLLSPTKASPRRAGRSTLLSPTNDIPTSGGKGSLLSPMKDIATSIEKGTVSPTNVNRGAINNETITSPVRNLLPSFSEKRSSMRNIVLTHEQFEIHPEEALKAKYRGSRNSDSSANASLAESLFDKVKRTSVTDSPRKRQVSIKEGDQSSSTIPKEKADTETQVASATKGGKTSKAIVIQEVSGNSTYSLDVSATNKDEHSVHRELPNKENGVLESTSHKDSACAQQKGEFVRYDPLSESVDHVTQNSVHIRQKDSISEDASDSNMDSDSDEEFLLLPVSERKTVRIRHGSPLHSDYTGAESGVTAYHLNVEEGSEGEVSKSSGSNKLESGISTSPKPGGSTSALGTPSERLTTSKARQMTMKEFIQKLADKPMPPPKVVNKAKDKIWLADLLKDGSSSTVRKPPSKIVVAKKTKDKKPLPMALSKSVTREIFTHFAKCKVSESGMNAVMEVSEKYWKNLTTDLINIVNARKGSDEILGQDMRKLMSRQGLITDENSLYALVEKYLPVEDWNIIIPTAFAKGNVYPPVKVIEDMFE